MIRMPSRGEKAPLFEGASQTGEIIRLSDLAGQKVALYFYPEDHTTGCIKQACNLRDNHDTLLQHGITVIGVSPDASHESFTEKYSLPFVLLADPQRVILEAYGVWGPKNVYGKSVIGVKRTTFLIDEEGTIHHVFKRPKLAAHSAEILRAFGLQD